MNDVAICRGIIDACCYVVGYLSTLNLNQDYDDFLDQVRDVFGHVADLAHVRERELVDEVFLPKKSE